MVEQLIDKFTLIRFKYKIKELKLIKKKNRK